MNRLITSQLSRHVKTSNTCLVARFILILILIANQSIHLSAKAQSTDPNTKLPLASQSNMKYLGAFRLPNGSIGTSSFSYCSGPIAYNPNDGCLFVTGHVYDQKFAEVSIPALVIPSASDNSTHLDDLNTATVAQTFGPSPIANLHNNNSADSVGNLGGLMVVGNQIIGTAYVYYDAHSPPAQASVWFSSSLNLASMSIQGLCQVGTLGGGYVSGYMCPVPSNWWSDLGAPYLIGQSILPVVSRTSLGPGAFGFDPSKLSVNSITADVPYVYYTENNATLGTYTSNPPLFNGNCGVGGVFFVPGTRSILFIGDAGLGPFCYGDPGGDTGVKPGGTNSDGAEDCNDPNRGGKGQHSFGGKYAYQIWAYDANDFLAVKNGTKNPWDIVPYTTWQFQLLSPSCVIGGTSYDPASGRLYVCELGADTEASYSYLPVIHAFQITGGTAPSPTPPSPTPISPSPSPTPKSPAAAKAAEKAAEQKLKEKEAALRAAAEAAKRKAEALKAKEAAAKREAAKRKVEAEKAASEKERHN